MIKVTFFLIGGLALAVSVVGNTNSSRLYCWHCSSLKHGNCGTLNFRTLSHDVLETCPENHVCYKFVVFFEYKQLDGTIRVKPRYYRGCTAYDPLIPLGECTYTRELSPPYPGEKCFCNDTNYCNGSGTVKKLTEGNLLLLPFVISLSFCLNRLNFNC